MAVTTSASGELDRPVTQSGKPPRFPAVLTLLCITALLGVAVATFQSVKKHEIGQAQANLAAIANLKQRQVSDWLQLLKRDFDGTAIDSVLPYVIEPWLKAGRPHDESESKIAERLAAVRSIYGLKSVQLFGIDGRELARAGVSYPPPDKHELLQAQQSQSGLVTEIHAGESGNEQDIHVDVVGALRVKHDEASSVVAVMVFHAGLSDSLFPLIQQWPAPSETAETLLVKREQDDVVYLNDLRHRKNLPHRLRLPLASHTSAALAALGERGQIEARDYRGQPVLAEIRPITGTTWLLIAKQDLAEIHAPVVRAGWIAGSVTLVLSGFLGLLLRFWHGRQLAYYTVRAAQAEARFGSLLRQANDIILLMDERGTVMDANAHAFDALGYPRDQLIGMHVARLAGTEVPAGVFAEAFDGCNGAVEFVGESLLLRADGRQLPAEVKCKLIESHGNRYRQAIIRDITERKAREAELAKREALYRGVVESQLDGFWLIDRGGRLLEVNEAYVQRSGYSRQELLSMRVSDLDAVHTAQDIAGRIENIIHAGSDLFETVHRTKDGTNWLAEVNLQYLPHAGGILCAFILDIRQRKRAESLWQIRLKLSELARAGNLDALMQESLDTAQRFTGSNIGFFHFVHENQQDLILQTWSSNSSSQDSKAKGVLFPISEAATRLDCCLRRAPVVRNNGACLSGGHVLLDGSSPVTRELSIPVIRQGRIVAILSVGNKATDYEQSDVDLVKDLAELAMDLVAERQTELALRESEERYRRIVTSANEGIWWLDERDHTLFVNPALSAMLGYSAEEMVGTSVERFVYDEDLASLRQRLERRHAGQDDRYEQRFRRQDGSVCWCRISATVLRDGEGRYAGSFALFTDISSQKQAEQQLQLAASVFASTQEAILITDPQGTIIDVNPAFIRTTGYTREEIIGKNPRLLKSGRHAPEFYGALWAALAETGTWSGEIWNRRKNGDIFPEWLTISSVRDDAGRVTSYIGVTLDISLLKAHEEKLEYMAYFDLLTGLPNRVLLVDRMNQAIAHARRNKQLLAVGYLDLDGFKPVNDQFGHALGDLLLIEVASRISSVLREEDTVSRLGGDEFVLLLQGMDDQEDCQVTLLRLLEQINQPWPLAEGTVQVSASIGVTLYPLDDSDPDSLLRHADQAMYRAKRLGKSRYVIYDNLIDSQPDAEPEGLAEIRMALENRDFELHYQPKINLRSGAVGGVEALLRWNHRERGLIFPGDFLPQISGHPLTPKLDRWVMTEGLRQAAAWADLGLNLEISVNISAESLQAKDFMEFLSALVAQYPGLLRGLFEFEIVETAALQDIHQISSVIQACKELGIGFALDDFGTGYSSLTYLRHLPAVVLKIDQSFVRNMLDDDGDLAIVQGVIGLSRAFGLKSVAEGVETAVHGARLLQLGCDMAQGYGIARPMPAAEIPEWVRRWNQNSEWRSSVIET
ncbi:MAG: PAS domain S-box protein [Methylococcaceae bacterium]|nr:PAS domain S-box protein [Methylococcaceae bacterium]